MKGDPLALKTIIMELTKISKEIIALLYLDAPAIPKESD